MVKKIIHIADLHVPNASSGKPYNEMLKQLAAEILAEVKDDNKEISLSEARKVEDDFEVGDRNQYAGYQPASRNR